MGPRSCVLNSSDDPNTLKSLEAGLSRVFPGVVSSFFSLQKIQVDPQGFIIVVSSMSLTTSVSLNASTPKKQSDLNYCILAQE